jgi:hypothetical protein
MPGMENSSGMQSAKTSTLALHYDPAILNRSLEELAEIERSGLFVQGMGLAESGLRENAGDYAGAVAAAYKELAWAYGGGLVQKSALKQGMENVLAMNRGREAPVLSSRDIAAFRPEKPETKGGEDTARIAAGILAFMEEQWDTAERTLRSGFDETEEPDGFIRWMILVCALEKNRDDHRAAAAYRAIRARYVQFPEYWYRGARAFSGTIAGEYAEWCVSLAPEGPFAAECRNILASLSGLKSADGPFLRSKSEIEKIVTRSVNQGDPKILDPLIPLISLPDNPYTIYALGVMRALAASPQFRDYFNTMAAGSGGRLAERLAYICRS